MGRQARKHARKATRSDRRRERKRSRVLEEQLEEPQSFGEERERHVVRRTVGLVKEMRINKEKDRNGTIAVRASPEALEARVPTPQVARCQSASTTPAPLLLSPPCSNSMFEFGDPPLDDEASSFLEMPSSATSPCERASFSAGNNIARAPSHCQPPSALPVLSPPQQTLRDGYNTHPTPTAYKRDFTPVLIERCHVPTKFESEMLLGPRALLRGIYEGLCREHEVEAAPVVCETPWVTTHADQLLDMVLPSTEMVSIPMSPVTVPAPFPLLPSLPPPRDRCPTTGTIPTPIATTGLTPVPDTTTTTTNSTGNINLATVTPATPALTPTLAIPYPATVLDSVSPKPRPRRARPKVIRKKVPSETTASIPRRGRGQPRRTKKLPQVSGPAAPEEIPVVEVAPPAIVTRSAFSPSPFPTDNQVAIPWHDVNVPNTTSNASKRESPPKSTTEGAIPAPVPRPRTLGSVGPIARAKVFFDPEVHL